MSVRLGSIAALVLALIVAWPVAAAPVTSSVSPRLGSAMLMAIGSSGVSGTASLKVFPASNQALIELRVSGLPKGASRLWRIVEGACATPGGPVFASNVLRFKTLRANADGIAFVTATVPSSALLLGSHAIVVDGVSGSAACGDLAAKFEVIAGGLDNPHGLTIGPGGAIYVAEAGRGGNGPCVVGGAGEPECIGQTGAVTRIANGHQQRIVTGLPSFAAADGSAATGPYDIAFAGNDGPFIAVGLHNDPAVRDPANAAGFGAAGADLGKLFRLTSTGALVQVADLAAFETTANPDGEQLASNPISLVASPTGFVIADASANDLLRVSPTGTVETLAVFPSDRTAPAPPIPGFPVPPGTPLPFESVPTAVVRGPDGAYYVGELTGFPFPIGGARVYRIVPGQAPTVYAQGFTNIIDLAFAPDGGLYVLELTADGLLAAEAGNLTGALKRVAPGGGATTIVARPGLVTPGGLAVAADGTVYISNKGTFAGSGEVIRLRPG